MHVKNLMFARDGMLYSIAYTSTESVSIRLKSTAKSEEVFETLLLSNNENSLDNCECSKSAALIHANKCNHEHTFDSVQ